MAVLLIECTLYAVWVFPVKQMFIFIFKYFIVPGRNFVSPYLGK